MRVATPNLFSFATSELSQDAFLCWLAALTAADEPKLKKLGQSFVGWLWSTCRSQSCDAGTVRLIERPVRQKNKIDISFEAEVGGTRTVFAIEDKTNTSQHSDQLERYKRTLNADNRVLIYFKTGYHFGEDLIAKESGYTVIGLEMWVRFLEAVNVENDIFHDYRRYVSETLRERTAALDALRTPEGFKYLCKDYVQFEFLNLLRMRCAHLSPSPTRTLRHGANLGGTPWTQLDFAWFGKALPGEIGEALFHRIDRRKADDGNDHYYVSTRQYARVKGSPEAKQAKKARLSHYRKAFAEAKEEAGSGLVFSKPAGDHQGANESEIGVLFFNDTTNTTPAVLERFPLVHDAFIKRVGSHVDGVPQS